MQNLLKSFIENLKRSASLFFVSIAMMQGSYAANGKMPIDDTTLALPDGRAIEAIRCGTHCHCLVIKRDRQILGKQCFEEQFDRLWDYAFFVPIKPKKYVWDLDRDGSVEIGVATWDGGNNIANRYALAFSVRGNKLIYYGRQKFNLEYGESVYK